MKVNHIHHIAINTLDIEESVAFYRDVMGFAEAARADMGELTLVYMRVRGDTYMELFDMRGKTVHGTAEAERQGLRHIAFDVDGVAEWNERLKEKGVPFFQEMSEMPQIGKRALLVRDPDGVVLELCEDL